eukprot:s4552_g4.t1
MLNVILSSKLRVQNSTPAWILHNSVILTMAVNMNKLNNMTKEQLKNYLYEEFHEHAYHKWTKVEIRQRLLELHNVNVEEMHRGTTLTATQQAVREVRVAAKKKMEIVKLCEEKYKLEVGKNDTIAILEARLLKIIYDTTEPEGGDAIGFGKNGHLQYREMLAPEHENYAQWVMTTAKENPSPGCDPRLYRLARWLETQNMEGRKKTLSITPTAAPKKTSRGYPTSPRMHTSPSAASSSYEHMAKQDQKIDALAEVLADIKTELRELKGEKVRKQTIRPGTDTEMSEGAQSDTSFFKINTPPAHQTKPKE